MFSHKGNILAFGEVASASAHPDITIGLAIGFLQTNMALTKFNPYSSGIDFRYQNMTSTDFIFWRLKSIPAL